MTDAENLARFREHSIHLNGLSWRIAVAVGDVPEGVDQIEGDVDERLTRLIALAGGGKQWAPSWATIAAHPCVTVRCSHCRQALDCDGEGGSWHYDDVDEALKAALEYGWTSDVDRLLCKSCAEEIVCARDGHRWGDHHHSEGFTGYNGTVYPPDDWWECAVCEHTVHEQPEGWVPPIVRDPSTPTLLDGDPWAGESS